MIRCNLANLLGERQLKMAAVIKETGVTRPTLTALFYNNGKGVQIETVNTLCNFLKVTPGDFFGYIPYDFTYEFTLERNSEIKKEEDNAYNCAASIGVSDANKNLITTISLKSRLYHTESRLGGKKLYKGFLYVEKGSAEVWEELKKEIPIEFQVDISKYLETLIYDYYQENFKYTDENYTDLAMSVEL